MVRSKSSTTLKLSWTLLLACFVSTVRTSEYLKAKKGDNATLRCNGEKPLNWLNEDNEIIGRHKGRVQQNKYGNLFFRSVQLSDSGIYTCSSIGGIEHNKIQLEVSAAPVLVNITKFIDVEKGKTAVMNCSAEGYPDPVITWFAYKDGQKQMIANGGTISATMPNKYRQLYFLCKAENEFGQHSVNITVNVVGKPEVKPLEKSFTRAIGQNVTVHCAFKSKPSILFMKWLKNGELVKDSNRKRISFRKDNDNEMVFLLTIEKLKEKDFGDYVCMAANRYGNETQKIQITLDPTKSYRTPKKKPRVSPLSASTELVITSGEIQKQTTKSKNQDNRDIKEEAATQSSESVSSNMGSVCKNSWPQFTAMILLPLFMCTSFFLS